MNTKLQPTRAHQLDPAWIIALWLAIHGGDPAPEGPIGTQAGKEVFEAAEHLSASLARSMPISASPEQVEQRLRGAGFMVDSPPGCCVGYGGHLVCVRDGSVSVRPRH